MPIAAHRHHADFLRDFESIRTLAERADRTAIDRFLNQPSATSQLDDHTLDFLRRIQNLVLATTQKLTRALDTGELPTKCSCRQDGTPNSEDCSTPYSLATAAPSAAFECPAALDTAEAWRRAHVRLPTHDEDPILIHIREFEDGYQAIPVVVAIPTPPPVPTIETPTTPVIDKVTGTVTWWPLLPLDVLARQYRRYKHREPMVFTENANGLGTD